MKLIRALAVGAIAAAFAVGCSDSTDPGDVTGNDLAGTWDATSVVFTPDAGGTAVDVVPLGFGLEITFNAEGGYTATFTEPGEAPDLEIGTYTVVNGVLTLTPVGEDAETMTIDSFSGSTMVLSDSNAEFDFDDNGTEEPANMTATMVKQ